MFPRARLRTARTSRATGCGWDDSLFDRKLPSDRVAAEGAQGQGSRTPCLDTPHRDCSRRRLRPNPDRFGHLLSRTPASSLSGVTWGEIDAAFAARACKARVARGPCGARFPRRNRTLTNPRGLPSLAVRGANGDRLFRDRRAASATAPSAFFTIKNTCEGRPHGLRWLGHATRKSSELLYRRRTAAPPYDFCVRVKVRSQMSAGLRWRNVAVIKLRMPILNWQLHFPGGFTRPRELDMHR
jgi:hypothetical protein